MDVVEILGGQVFFGHVIAAFVFAMIVNIISSVIRKVAELVSPDLKNSGLVMSRVWRELLLPILPVVIGASLAAAITSFPYPEVFAKSLVMRVIYGTLAGFFSTWAYRIIKTLVQRKWNVELPDVSGSSETVPSAEPSKKD